jgi:tetratricopeptide (TPR) repeat protein
LYLSALTLAGAESGREAEAAHILIRFTELELDQGYLEKADSLGAEAWRLRMKSDAHPDEDLAEIHLVLGDVALKFRNMDSAQHHFSAALALLEALHVAPHPDIAAARQSLGVFFIADFQEDSAIFYLENALQMYEQLEREQGIGFRRPSILHALGLAWMRKGKPEKATAFLDQALASCYQLYGKRHHMLEIILDTKAILLADLQQTEAAIQLFEECLALNRSLYGPSHPRVAGTLGNLATLKSEQLDYQGAEAMHREALAIMQASEGTPQSLAILYSNLALSLENQGKYDSAYQYYLKCLALDRELHGSVHVYIVDDLNNLGDLMEDMGKMEAATAYYREALALLDSGLNEENHFVATTYLVLGRRLNESGQNEAAMPLLKKGLRIRQAVLPPNSSHIATAQRMLAEGWMEQGAYDQADSLLRTSLASLDSTLGPDHPVTRSSRARLEELEERK